MHHCFQDEVWFFILPCDWRFLPELGPPPFGLAGFFRLVLLMRSQSKEIVDLTICRALFAAWVFYYHVDLHAHFSAEFGALSGLLRRGYLGVDGFFVLSGLILAKVHPELGISPKSSFNFWGRRLARLYPVHLATILLLSTTLVLGLLFGMPPRDPRQFALSALAQNLLLIQAWGFADRLAWNYPAWSISAEWAGYLLFPLLLMAITRLSKVLAGAVLCICLAVLGAVDYWKDGFNLTFAASLWRFFPEFILGIVTARLLPVLARRAGAEILAALGAVLTLTAVLWAPDALVVVGLWTLLAGFACRAEAGGGQMLPRLPAVRFLGIVSYSYYMAFATIEMFLAQLYRREGWDPGQGKLIYIAAMTALTLLLAISLHHLIENPARKRIDGWLAATSWGSSRARHPQVSSLQR